MKIRKNQSMALMLVQSLIASSLILLGIYFMMPYIQPLDESQQPQPNIVTTVTTSPYKTVVKTTDLQCLAENIYHEAGNQPEIGKVAVGVVTINRTKDHNFPKSVCGVVKQSAIMSETGDRVCQFSWVCNSDLKLLARTSKQWNDSVRIAQMLLEGGYDQNKVLFENAKYFHSVSLKTDWKKRHAMVTQIGDHVFYK